MSAGQPATSLSLQPFRAAACYLMVVRDTPTGFEVAPQPLTKGRTAGFTLLLLGVPAVLGWLIRDLPTVNFFSTPLMVGGCLLGGLYPFITTWAGRKEQERGPTLVYNRSNTRFDFPRAEARASEADLKGFWLVQERLRWGSDSELVTQLHAVLADGRRFLVCSGTMHREFKPIIQQLTQRLHKPVQHYTIEDGQVVEAALSKVW